MRFDPSWQLKWLNADNPRLANSEFNILNHCVLLASKKKGQSEGFCAFQPRDLNEKFFQRLELRAAQPEFSQSEFELIVPPYIQHRVTDLSRLTKLRNLKITISPFVNVRNVSGVFYLRPRLRVVNVDDSPVLLKFLKHVLTQFEFVDVISQVSDSREAVTQILKSKPDVVTMDIQMPYKNGVEVVQDLLKQEYYPVLMVSSVSLDDGPLVMNALNEGAFDYIQKPKAEERETFRTEVLEKILMALEGRNAHSALHNQRKKATPQKVLHSADFDPRLLWCLGASTGGTQALTEVFKCLPSKIPPILVVQHIPPVYSKSFADTVNDLCPFRVKEAEHGEAVLPNHVYIAPGGQQMGVTQKGQQLLIEIKDAPPVNRFKPSVDYLFDSVATTKGFHLVAGLLTGMGRDGAKGLLHLLQIGAATIAQDEASSVVYGMPRAAMEIGAASRQVGLGLFAQALFEESLKVKKSA